LGWRRKRGPTSGYRCKKGKKGRKCLGANGKGGGLSNGEKGANKSNPYIIDPARDRQKKT